MTVVSDGYNLTVKEVRRLYLFLLTLYVVSQILVGNHDTEWSVREEPIAFILARCNDLSLLVKVFKARPAARLMHFFIKALGLIAFLKLFQTTLNIKKVVHSLFLVTVIF